jgi:predicted permease
MLELPEYAQYAWRYLSRRPWFAALVIATLACGIGPATAMFSVVDAVLLRPLAFPHSGRLVTLWERDLAQGIPKEPVDDGSFEVYRQQTSAFTAAGAFVVWDAALRARGGFEPIQSVSISDGLFEALGVRPLLGRTFRPGDCGSRPRDVVLLSYAFWQGRFGSDPEILGKTLSLVGDREAKPYTIVGVMPPGFEFPYPLSDVRPEIWAAGSWPVYPAYAFNTRVVARLKQGVSFSEAQAQVATVAKRLALEYPRGRKGVSAFLLPLRSQEAGSARRPLLLIFAATAFILLIASANASALLQATLQGRRKEMAVRAAVGAGPGRLLAQLTAELALIGMAAAAVGLAVAAASLPLLVRWLPHGLFIPRLGEARIDWRVLAFSVLISWLACFISGLAPARALLRPNLTQALKEGGSFSPGRGARAGWLSRLVPLEIAVTALLLGGAGLMLRSMTKLEHVTLGFDPGRLLTAAFHCPEADGSNTSWISCNKRFLRTVEQLPGVRRAALADSFPLSRRWPWEFNFGRKAPSTYTDWPYIASLHPVSSEYFRLLGDQLLAGRLFTERDDQTASRRVVIINEAMARRYWPNRTAVGQQITITPSLVLPPPAYTIVGVVRDFQQFGLASQPQPAMYVPLSEWPNSDECLIDAAGNPRGLARMLPKLAAAADPEAMVYSVATGQELFADALARPELVTRLLDLLAMLGLILAAFGTYGVVSYVTAQRTHEVGIRMAVGARPQDVTTMVVAQGMRWGLMGIAAGLGVAVALGRVLRSLLYHVRPTDPLTLAGVALLMLAVALLASYIPARHAAKVDPVKALRSE